jgi:sugar O-acyltransferase (sialic acid O-acetyltransferase NeuD family)
MSKKKQEVILMGYSGHAFVVCDILLSQNIEIIGYCDNEEKAVNPYELVFLGQENDSTVIEKLSEKDYFTAIGNNTIRRKINERLEKATNRLPTNAIHIKSSISSTARIGNGVMVGDGCIINACSEIGDGVICNTQSVIEHECKIGAYTHIGPGAVLCGNVKVGINTFIGARAVIKQGITIGKNVVIGAGTVVINDILDSSVVVGNPQKNI